MATEPHIYLPTLSSDQNDYRSIIENDVLSILESVAQDNIKVQKYYKTANEQIYTDCMNIVQSVPGWLFRTKKVDSENYTPNEKVDSLTARIEVINAVPVRLEKGVHNVDRYAYTMDVLCREALRDNPIKTLPRNRRRPYIYLGNRDIFRDDDIDILLSEFNVEFIEV